MKGNNTKSIRRKSLPNTRNPIVGIKSLVLHHEAAAGEVYIDLSNLNVPIGLSNPSPSEIARLQIKTFASNFLLTSNQRPLWIENVSYEIVSNLTFKLLLPALEDEVFVIRHFNHQINGTVIADVRTPSDAGPLLEGERDFNLGEAIPIVDIASNQWPIQILRSGVPMVRNNGNAAYTGDDSIGNYQMIDNGSGWCQVIRFNIEGDVDDEPIMWNNHGALGERPDLSVLQEVDKINGVVDKMRDDLLEVTGYDVEDPTRYAGGVATNQDLKSFGDKVHTLESLYDVTQKLSEYTKTKWQMKYVLSTFSGTGIITALTMNNITIGKTYRVKVKLLEGNSGGGNVQAKIYDGATELSFINFAAPASNGYYETSKVFVATGTTVTVDMLTNPRNIAPGIANSYIILEEKPNHEETTDFT